MATDLKQKEYVRSALFGLEDSLVSTTGLVAGIAVGAENKSVVLLAGIIAITIEALSMGASEYLSDDAVQELDKIKRHRDSPKLSGLIMFVSYFAAGLVPLLPVAYLSFPYSLILCICSALIGLFLLGYIKGRLLHTASVKGGMKMLIVGGLTTLAGVAIGFILRV